MNNKISNKRKSLVTTNVIPNKSRKILNTTLSPITNNKSPKTTSKIIEKSGGKYITFEEDRKPNKIYEDEGELTDDLDENGIDDLIEEINGNNGLYDSNNEESEMKEADSGRYLELEEDGSSGEEVEINGEATVDEKTKNCEKTSEKTNSDDYEEASSDEELEIDEKSTFDEQTRVEANLDNEFKDNKEAKVSDDSDEETEVSDDSDEDENGEENQNKIIDNKYKVENFSVLVKGIKHEKDIAELFQGCKIMYFDFFPRETSELLEYAFVYFENKKSCEKALKKDGAIFNGNVIGLERLIKSSLTLTAEVDGLHPIAKIEYVFNDCEIEYYKRDLRDKSKAVVHFKNEESLAKALSKNNLTINNCKLKVKKYKKPYLKKYNEVQIEGLNPITKVRDCFKGCNIISSRMSNSDNSETRIEFLTFDGLQSMKIVLLRDKTEHDGCIIRVFRTDCAVEVLGAIPESKLKDFFNDCNIRSYTIMKNNLGYNTGRITILFGNIFSAKKALMKDRTEFCGRMILVRQEDKPKEVFIPKEDKYKVENFSVHVLKGITHKKHIEELFRGCKIMNFDFFPRFNNNNSEHAFVYFKDKESLQKALKKNKTKFNGNLVILERLIKNSTTLTVQVYGFQPTAKILNIFKDCEIEYYKKSFKHKSKAVVHFKDEESVKKALSKNDTLLHNRKLSVQIYEGPSIIQETAVDILGINKDTNVNDIFNDCKIKKFTMRESIGCLTLADEESMKKALLKDKTEHDGCIIRVFRTDCAVEVLGAIPESKLKDVFNDSNIRSFTIMKNNLGSNTGRIIIHFEDIQSVKNALKKNRTECCGRMILVEQAIECSISENQGDFKQNSFSFEELDDLEQNKFLLGQIKSQILTLKKEIFEKEKSLKKIANSKS